MNANRDDSANQPHLMVQQLSTAVETFRIGNILGISPQHGTAAS
jgi:hypothetical protein